MDDFGGTVSANRVYNAILYLWREGAGLPTPRSASLLTASSAARSSAAILPRSQIFFLPHSVPLPLPLSFPKAAQISKAVEEGKVDKHPSVQTCRGHYVAQY